DGAVGMAEAPALARHDVERPAGLGQDVERGAPGEPRRYRQSVLQIAVTLPLDLQVERKDERRTLRALRALDERGGEAAVAHHVELEPEGLARARGDVLE